MYKGTQFPPSSLCRLDIANFDLELLQLFLETGVLLGHLLVLLLPLVTLVLEGLHLAFKVAGLDIGLTKPRYPLLAKVIQETEA